MTLLVDPPLLVATGAAIQRLAPTEASARTLERLAAASFLAGGVAFYINAPITRPLWGPLRVRSGRDFMLNSYLLRLEDRHTPLRVHLIAAAVFASYPAWLRLGRRVVGLGQAGR